MGRPIAAVVEPQAQQVGVGEHPGVERELVGERAGQPFLAVGRRDRPGERPPCIADDVGERGVAHLELPQRRPGPAAGGVVAVLGEPGDELERLAAIEGHGGTAVVDDVDPETLLIDPTSVAVASVLSVVLATGVYLLLSRGMAIATPLYVVGCLVTAEMRQGR